MLHWYLIHTKVSGEKSAQLNLERQGYEVYLPLLLQRIAAVDRSRKRIVPLFPRYLFLRLDEGRQSLRPVHSTIGVAAVVRFGFQYTIVPDEVVRGLRDREDPETALHQLRRPPLFPGAAVRITAGAFDGVEGIFERPDGAERVLVLLQLLGQQASVRLPCELVTASFAA
ncbi:MAG TPA: transcription termination/antitermination NusG family protein [Steroidobacteraceae bacterium]